MIRAASPAQPAKSARPSKRSKPPRAPRSRKPEGMTLEAWQIALRREFGREQRFRIKNLGGEPVFSEFEVNMDQPWNPAVLEQRIGRVHRLGQRRPVRVVHFVAQGTIEHGMLDVMAFKKSLFAGVLAATDGPVPASGDASGTGSLVERDAKTGRSYLRLPLPERKALNRLAELLRSALR